MRMKSYSAALVSTMTAALFVFMLAGMAAGQGRYTSQYSRGDVDTIIRNVEDRADEFRRDFYAELERSNLGNNQERVYRNQVTNFENATDRLRRNFDSDNNWWQSRNQVRNVVTNATPLNTTMNSIAFRRRIERQWNQLRNAVNRLADTYDLPGIAGGGWNGGPWNPGNPGGGGGQTSTPPNWAQGTFYSVYPRVTMTISRNGRVASDVGGEAYSGRYYQGRIYSQDGGVATVTRTANGIRTYNSSNGQTIDFTRQGSGGNDDGGWEGPTTTPPSWAIGTFYSNNGVTMTINRNGRVTSRIGNETYYGRYYAGSIYTSSQQATVTQTRNGIETYNRTTGERLVFRRR